MRESKFVNGALYAFVRFVSVREAHYSVFWGIWRSQTLGVSIHQNCACFYKRLLFRALAYCVPGYVYNSIEWGESILNQRARVSDEG